MPTGYTGEILDKNISFKDFVLLCSRNFGATVHMRDDSFGTPLRKRDSASYHKEKYEEAVLTKKLFDGKPSCEKHKLYKKDVDRRITRYRELVARADENRRRLTTMLEKVKEWTPPTAEHIPLKSFMIQQLTDTIKWDATPPEKPVIKDYDCWLKEEISSYEWDINYHKEGYEKDLKRDESCNLWISQLFDSLE